MYKKNKRCPQKQFRTGNECAMASFVSIGKSKQFHDFLRNSLLNGEYKVGDKFPSIRELSKKYEISRPTVNSVISNLVNEGFLVVDQGRGTFVARTDEIKKSKTTNLIGFLMIDYLSGSEIENVILGHLGDLFQKKGYYMIPVNTNNDISRFYSLLSMMANLEVGGLVIVPPYREDYDINVVRNLVGDIPMVCINRDLPGCNHDLVQMDFYHCGKLATEHLLKQGRKRIMVQNLFGPTLYGMLADGCAAACNEAGYDAKNVIIEDWSWESPESIRNADGLISSDGEIYRNLSVIREAGKEIAKDLGIVGINDSNFSRLCSPELTAIRNSGDLIAKECCDLLFERMNGPREMRIKRIPCKLVPRNT